MAVEEGLCAIADNAMLYWVWGEHARESLGARGERVRGASGDCWVKGTAKRRTNRVGIVSVKCKEALYVMARWGIPRWRLGTG